MEFYLQMGHGMQRMCEELLALWGRGTVILSPVNIPPTSLPKFSKKIIKKGGSLLFDPQLYSPEECHHNLDRYDYWPNENILHLNEDSCEVLITKLAALNKDIGTASLIVPSFTSESIDEDWDEMQRTFMGKAKVAAPEMERLQTISVTGEVLLSDSQVEKIVQYAESWDVEGVYIACQHPDRSYIVEHPVWMSNLLALVAGIKRQQKKVVVGYSNHQMLCLALAKCDAIASGNFLNVRSFQPARFRKPVEGEISRRSTWYYCPQALSEYKLYYLDFAQRENVLDAMAPPPEMKSLYSDMLFRGGQPSSTGFNETEAYRHYLHCLRQQTINSTKSTYKETKDSYLEFLKSAKQIIEGLQEHGVSGQGRDFLEIIDVNKSAVFALDNEFHFPLSHEWDSTLK